VTTDGVAARRQAAADPAPRERLVTRPFAAWLGAATVAMVGDGVLYFAVGWTAAGLGGQTAGLLLTLVVLPRTLLMLVGGAVGDRWGLRRTMVGCDAFMLGVLACFLLVSGTGVPVVALLAGLALAAGTASAFRMPAAGAFPRLFVDDDNVPRALSLAGSLLQVARMAGPPLGGVVVAALGMRGAVAATLLAVTGVLLVLVAVRPPRGDVSDRHEGSTLRRVGEGLAAARTVPGLLPLLGAVALVAGSIIPMLALSLPLAARARGWSADVTGTVESAWIVGTLTVTLVLARTGTLARPLPALAGGPVLAGLGVLAVAASPHPATALGGAVVTGVGTAVFTGHAFPLYMLRTPDGMLARFQSLLGVVQAAAMLLGNNLLGTVGGRVGPTEAIVVAALVSMLAGPLLLVPSALRTFGGAPV
jgi:hypothetical protein